MKHTQHRWIFTLFLLTSLLLTTGLAEAGVVVRMETRVVVETPGEEAAPPVSRGTLIVQGDRVRFDSQVDETGKTDQSILFLSAEGRMLTIDHENRWYGEMNPALLAALKQRLAQALQEVQKQLAEIPEEQRAATEKIIAERLSPSGAAVKQRKVQPTEDRRQVGKYPASRYEVLRDGKKVRDVWVTDWSNVEGGEELREGFEAMEEFVRRMMDSLAQLPRIEALVQRMGDNMLKELTELPGLPVLSVQYDGGKPKHETTVVAIEVQTVPEEAVAPPAGYQSRNMFAGVPQ